MAKKANLFHFYHRLHRKNLYGEALVSLRKIVPNNTKKLKKGDKIKCIIAGLKMEGIREYLQSISFKDDNRAISLKDKERSPLGTRVFSKLNKEIRLQGFNKICMVSRGVV